MKLDDTLFLVPARGGSKRLPGKNIKLLGGRPLINYTIDIARELTSDQNICVSTDDPEIQETVTKMDLELPFARPASLAQDSTGMRDVILHALHFYQNRGKMYSRIILLQPTSPFRTKKHIHEAFELYEDSLDMVASVKISKANPYFMLFTMGDNGFLNKALTGNFLTMQDCPKFYEFNGAIYIINCNAILQKELYKFSKIRAYLMDEKSSTDIDTLFDFEFAEFLFQRR